MSKGSGISSEGSEGKAGAGAVTFGPIWKQQEKSNFKLHLPFKHLKSKSSHATLDHTLNNAIF